MKQKIDKSDLSVSGIVSRIRGFILDSQVDDSEHIVELLLGNPMSDDVADRELEESDARADRARHLVPLLYVFANSMAEGLVEHQRAHLEDEDVEDELPEAVWESTQLVFTKIGFSTALGAVSQLLDMGLISTPKKWRWFWQRKA